MPCSRSGWRILYALGVLATADIHSGTSLTQNGFENHFTYMGTSMKMIHLHIIHSGKPFHIIMGNSMKMTHLHIHTVENHFTYMGNSMKMIHLHIHTVENH